MVRVNYSCNHSPSVIVISSDNPGSMLLVITSTEKVYVLPLVRPEMALGVELIISVIVTLPPEGT